MTEWQELPLERCLSALIDYRGKSPRKSTTGIPVISAKVVKEGRILHPIEQTIDPEYYSEWMRRGLPNSGDVVLTTEGPLGEVAQLDDETARYALGQRIVVLRGRDGLLDNTFLKFLLQSDIAQRRLLAFATGTTVSGVSQKSLRQLPLPLPPIQEQQRIAGLLGSLDDKIELNRRMNETLEAMAQAIFRDWFVDFGPTRRKLEGATDPVTIMGGLVTDPTRAQELADLFPETLGDDGLPEGWKAAGLDEIAVFLNGLALQKYPAEEGQESLPVIKIAELRNGVTGKSNRASLSVPPKYVIKDGDFLFSWSGSLLAKFWTEGKGALNQHLFKVTSDTYPAWFYASWVNFHLPEFQRIAASKATTMGHIQREHLRSAGVVIPEDRALRMMTGVMAPLLEKTILNSLECRTLAATRDFLLPKLMSGEIRLGEAEELVEAAQ